MIDILDEGRNRAVGKLFPNSTGVFRSRKGLIFKQNWEKELDPDI